MSMGRSGMIASPRVYIIDDDAGLCESLTVLLATANIAASTFSNAEDFLEVADHDKPACLLLDVRLPGITGVELLEHVNTWPQPPIVVMITGHGDVPMAVSAMRVGAFHFVEKPFDPEALLSIVGEALKGVDRIADQQARAHDVAERYRSLTSREVQVLNLLIDGRPSKLIAYELSISTRTAEHHRSAVMKKMAARSLSHLVRMTLDLRRTMPALPGI